MNKKTVAMQTPTSEQQIFVKPICIDGFAGERTSDISDHHGNCCRVSDGGELEDAWITMRELTETIKKRAKLTAKKGTQASQNGAFVAGMKAENDGAETEIAKGRADHGNNK